MKVSSETSTPRGDFKVKQVVSYRVAVKDIARMVAYLADNGCVTEDDQKRLKEIASGR